jgi:hypothetical protein
MAGTPRKDDPNIETRQVAAGSLELATQRRLQDSPNLSAAAQARPSRFSNPRVPLSHGDGTCGPGFWIGGRCPEFSDDKEKPR